MKGIHICSNLEWKSVLSICQPEKCEVSPYGAYFIHQFEHWDEPAVVYFSGYSKIMAAGAAQFMIGYFNLSHIIVAGSSGGVAPYLEPLDVIIANETVIYDCIDRLELQAELFCEPFKTLINLEWLNDSLLPEKTYVGRVATADQDIDYAVKQLLQPENVLVADWESGAVALVCKLNEIQVTIFRGVSDVPKEGLSQEAQTLQYQTNTPKLMKRIFEKYLPLI